MAKLKVVIDPGHGSNESGACANGFIEKNLNLTVGLQLEKELIRSGFEVLMTRKDDSTLTLEQRGKIAVNNKADMFISVHFNAFDSNAFGHEVAYSFNNTKAKTIADSIFNEVTGTLGIRKRRVFQKESEKTKGTDWYGVLKGCYPIPGVIVEGLFLDNSEDILFLKQPDFLKKLAICYAKGICKSFGVIYVTENTSTTTTPTPSQIIKKHSILGKPVASKEQMVKFLLSRNSNPKINCSVEELVQYFIDEGLKEGVRGDVAFAQSIHETGNFNYGGIVKPEQNNFAGIGALNGNATGNAASFATPQLGVRAQIQHLKAYASKEALTQECIDPRFSLVTRGIAPNVEDLAGRWAYPGFDKNKYKTLDEALVQGETYGQMIMTIVDKMIAVKVEEPKTPVVETVDYKAKYEELKVANENLVSENSKIKSKLNAIIGIING